jgi:pimeloyl-ACP methyl ester carboxylesterase
MQQIGKFSKRLRVISYDRAGYGLSTRVRMLEKDWLDESVDELEGLLDQLNVQKAHLCGICVGGAIGLLFAARNPARAGNIVVAGTCCYGEEETTSRVLRLYPPPENLPPEWLHELADHHGETHGQDLYRVFYQAIREENGYPFKGYDLRPSLPSVKSPVLVIYGDRDNLFNLEQALTMYRCLDKSELYVIPGCGHLPNEERSQQFNAEVLDFMRRHPDRQLGKTQQKGQKQLWPLA